MADESLDIQDYLDASGDAAKRTRTVTVVCVIASVIVFAGLLNSMRSAWALDRLLKFRDMKDSYVATKLGPYPEPPLYSGKELDEARKLYRERFLNMYAALSRGYVENALSVRVPFFGITFDVNDLGIMGGISFLVILVWLRFCISREVDNLRLSFEEADRLGKGKEFYTLLAMRQVLTTPRTRYLKRSKFLVVAPKIIVWAAFMVHIGVVIHDFNTRDLAIGLKLGRYQLTMIAEVLLAIPLFVLSVMVTKRLIRMDRVWDRAWVTINKPEAGGGMKSSQAGALA